MEGWATPFSWHRSEVRRGGTNNLARLRGGGPPLKTHKPALSCQPESSSGSPDRAPTLAAGSIQGRHRLGTPESTQSQAPGGTSKFTCVAGWDALEKAVWVRRIAPATTAPTINSRLVNMDFLLPVRSPFVDRRLTMSPIGSVRSLVSVLSSSICLLQAGFIHCEWSHGAPPGSPISIFSHLFL